MAIVEISQHDKGKFQEISNLYDILVETDDSISDAFEGAGLTFPASPNEYLAVALAPSGVPQAYLHFFMYGDLESLKEALPTLIDVDTEVYTDEGGFRRIDYLSPIEFIKYKDGTQASLDDLASHFGNNAPFAFIKKLKSLYEGQGHATNLVSYLLEKPAMAILDPTDCNAESFFRHLGFKDSGLYVESEGVNRSMLTQHSRQ